MAKFIEASSDDAGLLLFNGNKTNETIAELKQSVNSFLENTAEAAKDVVDYVKDRFNDLNMGDTFKRLRSLKGELSFGVDSDEITRLETLEELTRASDRMKRFIMAHTGLREKFLEGEIQGYGEGYLNIQEEGLGSDFYDYRRVTNGMVLTETIKADEKDEKDTSRTTATTYFEELIDDDIELTTYEQFDILSTWDTIDAQLAKDDFVDFTEVLDTFSEDLFEA